MQIGLVGMPMAGKTTLFNLLTGNQQPTGIGGVEEVHIGSAVVPDRRIDFLEKLYKPKKTTHARIDFKDIPGVKMEDSKGRASRLLEEARSADALVQVVRAFSSPEVNSLAGAADPYRELTDYGDELILADLDTLEKRIERLQNGAKGKKTDQAQLATLQKLLEALEQEKALSSVELTPAEREMLAGQSFLSEKPLFIVINIDEQQLRSGTYPGKPQIESYAAARQLPVIEICAQVEMEISRLEPDEQLEFMEDLELKESGLGRLARMTYDSMKLISFFTVGEDEVKAWTVKEGTIARKAAGKIHSDIERGFIRAEVFHYNDLENFGTSSKVRDAGLFRLEGKDYPITDGDVISFRFNV